MALLAGLAVAAANLPAHAAGAPDLPLTLNGIAQATLGASQLTPDGVQCGLDLERLAAPARQQLADGGIELREDAPTRMTLSAITTQLPGPSAGGPCATAVMLGVYTRENFFSGTAGWLRSGYVVVWQRSVMVGTSVAEHPAAVSGAVGRLVEQMLTNWHEQNRRDLTVAGGPAPSGGPAAAAPQKGQP